MNRAPNQKDFQKFYEQHLDKVYRYIFFRTGHNRELTEDLVSEIFLKALEHFADYDSNKSTSSWIMTIAKNHLMNYWRDTKTTVPLDHSEESDDGHGEGTLLLTQALEMWQRSYTDQTVRDLLAKLSKTEQDIVTFHYLLGYSYAEIATMQGMSIAAAKVAAHRAIKKMRALL